MTLKKCKKTKILDVTYYRDIRIDRDAFHKCHYLIYLYQLLIFYFNKIKFTLRHRNIYLYL